MGGRVIRVAHKTLGEGCPTFVIAEAGCNHENDFGRAREMVMAAAEAGADAIKFQSFSPSTLVTRDAPKFWDIPGPGATQYEEFADAEPRFSRAQYRELITLARERGMLFFSTPCDEAWADTLDGLGVPLFKIASMDLTHVPLLEHVARKGKPIVLSTGASYLEEVGEAVAAIRRAGNEDIILLHCISSYPTPPEQVHLRMMRDLARAFPACVIGYSDHTAPNLSPGIPTLAVAAGAQVIEKHFTFDTTRPGYDHEISADYAGFARMVAEFRTVERVLGQERKAPAEVEARARRFGRRSLVAAVRIPQGTAILAEMVAVKRPGTGITPQEFPRVLGAVARREICEDEVLSWDALEPR